MKLRTTALAVALMASVSCLAVSAQAAPFGGWHGGGGGWHGGGWHGGGWGGGWAGAGLGFAAGAIIGSALATPYYGDGYYAGGDGYYAGGYGYSGYGDGYGYDEAPAVAYGYENAPVDSSYGYAAAPSYGLAYGVGYQSYGVAAEPAWGYGQRRYGYEQRYGSESYGRGGTYARYGTAMRTRPSSSVRGEYRTGAIPSENRRPLYAHYQGRADHTTSGTGVSGRNTGVGVGHLKSGAGEMDRGRRQ